MNITHKQSLFGIFASSVLQCKLLLCCSLNHDLTLQCISVATKKNISQSGAEDVWKDQ